MRMKLADRLAALVTLSPTQLRDQWDELEPGSKPLLTPDLTRRLFAYRLQEKCNGGLPAAVAQELRRISAGNGVAPTSRPEPVTIRPGTRLVREWNGRTISVEAVEGGFIWENRHYRSLTAIAREVTGAGWSGPRFFGFTRRG